MYVCIYVYPCCGVLQYACMYVNKTLKHMYVCMYVCMYGSVLLYDVISKGKWKRVRAQKDVAFYLPDLRMGAFERSELRYILYVCMYVCMYVCIAVMVVVVVRHWYSIFCVYVGSIYYMNNVSGTSSWDMPAVLDSIGKTLSILMHVMQQCIN